MSILPRGAAKRFVLFLAVAFFIMLPPPMMPSNPDWKPYPGYHVVPDQAAFFALAFQMAAVILLATALYAAVLFAEHVWRWRRRWRGGRT